MVLAAAGVMPAAAESPYGSEIIECVTAANDLRFNNPTNALGEPKRFVKVYYGDMGGVASSSYGGVVHPVVPAYGGGMHLSLISPNETDEDAPGYVVIAFDHDVEDDPDNPFGVDFIVFGNTGCTKSTGTGMTSLDDPTTCRLTAYGFSEESVVEVAQSADGPWYGSEAWRISDGFAPTLGHRYDPDNVDTNLYVGNLWWGAKTDATFPVDPHIDFADCAGLTLAELCQRYNGSAGGAGYDLADIEDLPVNAHGRKWFRYVKISCAWGEKLDPETGEYEGDFGFSQPEVDAVADVRPATGYELWRERHYTDWSTAWQATPDAIAANGLPNGLNCVFGLAPTDTVAVNVPFKVVSFEPGETEHVIKMLSPTRMTTTPKGLVVKEASSLGAGWKSVKPTLQSSESQGDGTWLNKFTVLKGKGAFFKLALDAE